jgi:3-isopropylmalate/(R)-2-methylmalate dehydratase small subunit
MGKYEDLVGKEHWLLALDGSAWTLGDQVQRSDILPEGCYALPPNEAARHLFEQLAPGLAAQIRRGDFLVAGEGFAADVTQKPLPAILRAAGIAAVIARSFGRYFEHSATRAGLPPLVVEETRAIKQGDRLRVDIEAHVVANKSSGDRYVIRNIDDAALAILRDVT